MEVGKLTVEVRHGTGKSINRKLRRSGKVPGVCYGVGLERPLDIIIDPKALKASLDPEKKQNTVIDLSVVGGDAERRVTAMLWEYQVHPIKRNVMHVDLIAIDPDKTIETEVPVEFVGRAAGFVEGGQLHIVRREIPVKCKPADIPNKFVVDVTPLEVGDTIHISDVEIPAGVEPAVSTSLSLVSCVAPRAEVEVAPEEGVEVPEGEAPAAGEAGGEGAAAEGGGS
jgi:large subunit ribosomal protein L25